VPRMSAPRIRQVNARSARPTRGPRDDPIAYSPAAAPSGARRRKLMAEIMISSGEALISKL
jgi:hypothetical protein